MLKYLVKRIGTAVITLFVAATITFFVMNLVPGDPFMSEKAPTAAAKAAMEAKYGLDKPLVVQYANYLKNLLHGDFGVSYVQAKNKPIMDIIKQAFPISAKIGAIAVVVATVIGIPLGCLSALRREKWQDNVIRVLSTVGIAVPGFVVATSFMILFAVKLKLVPASGLQRCGLRASGDHPGAVALQLHRPPHALQHAGRDRTGLYPHRQSQGHERVHHHVQARPQEFPDPCYYIHGPHDRQCSDRRIRGGEDLQHPRAGAVFCKVH